MMFQKSTRKFACDKEKIFKIEACNGPILLHPKGGFQPKNHWAWTWDAASKQEPILFLHQLTVEKATLPLPQIQQHIK